MDTPKPPSEMTDLELKREWLCIEDCDFGTRRTEELAAELERRHINL